MLFAVIKRQPFKFVKKSIFVKYFIFLDLNLLSKEQGLSGSVPLISKRANLLKIV